MSIELKNKCVIVTGAASGIGAATAKLFAKAGAKVVIADIKPEPLHAYAEQLRSEGLTVEECPTDVSDPEAVKALADFAEKTFGNIYISFNNAGVAMHGTPMHKMSLTDWQWVIDVNIKSIVNSIHHILPRMLKAGQPGYFINTASIGGLQVNPNWLTGAYSMTKYAVVAMSEGLRNELKDSLIKVLVLCPSAVATHLGDATSRPDRFGGATERPEQTFLSQAIVNGVSPEYVANRIMHAMKNGEFFIFTDSSARPTIEDRHQQILETFNNTEDFLKNYRSN